MFELFLAGRVHIEQQLNGGGWTDVYTGHAEDGIVDAVLDAEAFGSLGGAVEPGLTLPASIAEAGGGDTWDIRFTLQAPLALQVFYRIDEADGLGGWTEGAETTSNVVPSTPATITVTSGAGTVFRLYLISLRWHPWAA